MTIRQGSTLIFSEKIVGDGSALAGNPTGWLVAAQDGRDEPASGAVSTALVVDAGVSLWTFTLSNTAVLAPGRYLVFSRYVFSNGNVFIPEPTLVIVKG